MLHTQLSNGAEVIIKSNRTSKLIALQCWVHCGSMDEKPDERGMSHLLEHMLFKGTERRKVGEIAATVEGCGGDINAYTTFDRTVFYLTMTSDHAETACDLLSDAIYHSSFDPAELQRETEVVVEEIRRSLDNPAAAVGRQVFIQAFSGSEAGRPIIGSEESVRGFDRAKIHSFHRQWYQPQNISVVAVGDFDEEAMLATIEDKFGSQENTPTPARPTYSIQHIDSIGTHLIKGDYELPRLEITYQTPGFDHSDIASLDVAAFALGYGDLSRLNRRLRDELGLANAIGASLYVPKFGGIFSISAFPNLEKFSECVAAIGEELVKLKTSNPVSIEEINRARINLKADKLHDEETISGVARSLGFGLTTAYGGYYDDVYLAMLNNVTPESVAKAVERWLDLSKVVIVGMAPESATVEEGDIQSAYQDAVAGKNSQSSKIPKAVFDPELKELKEGVSLVYRYNPDARFVNMIATSEGGLRYETEANCGLYNAMSAMLAKATKQHDYEDLLKDVEGMGAALEGFSGKDSFGFRVQCLADYAGPLMSLWKGCLMQPMMPEQQWQALEREIAEDIRTENDSSAQVCLRRFQQVLYHDHPYRFPAYGTTESVARFNPEFLMQEFHDRSKSQKWIIGCVSSLPEDQIVDMIDGVFSDWQPQGAALSGASEKGVGVGSERKHHIIKQREQSHMVVGGLGLSWQSSDRAALDILNTVLGGQGGRLFINLRDRKSLAYTVSPFVNYGVHRGFVGAYIACSPSKVDEARESLFSEFAQIQQDSISTSELERAVRYIQGNHEAEMQRGMPQAMTMALMQLYGVGYDDFLQYRERIAAVTRDDVMQVAQKLLDPDKMVEVVVGPEA